MLVTHDIDEAVKMGDHVAVFAPGGHLAQYDVPAEVLGRPADDFVAEFVGASRGLRRLSVTPILREDLEPAPAHLNGTVQVSIDDTLEDALAALMRQDTDSVAVTAEGRIVGILTPTSVHAALRRSIAESGPSEDPAGSASPA
jgi:osmoprotectant transport system ATP-binding protein